MSDDGLDDFSDALPLAGREICEKVLADKYKSIESIYRDIKEKRPEMIKREWNGKMMERSFGQWITDAELMLRSHLFLEVERRFVVEHALLDVPNE